MVLYSWLTRNFIDLELFMVLRQKKNKNKNTLYFQAFGTTLQHYGFRSSQSLRRDHALGTFGCLSCSWPCWSPTVLLFLVRSGEKLKPLWQNENRTSPLEWARSLIWVHYSSWLEPREKQCISFCLWHCPLDIIGKFHENLCFPCRINVLWRLFPKEKLV